MRIVSSPEQLIENPYKDTPDIGYRELDPLNEEIDAMRSIWLQRLAKRVSRKHPGDLVARRIARLPYHKNRVKSSIAEIFTNRWNFSMYASLTSPISGVDPYSKLTMAASGPHGVIYFMETPQLGPPNPNTQKNNH